MKVKKALYSFEIFVNCLYNQQTGIWQDVHDGLRELIRSKKGRKESPSAAILDNQSVKTTFLGGQRGYDAAGQPFRLAFKS